MQELESLLRTHGGMFKLPKKEIASFKDVLAKGEEYQDDINLMVKFNENNEIIFETSSFNYLYTKKDEDLVFSTKRRIRKEEVKKLVELLREPLAEYLELSDINARIRTIVVSSLGFIVSFFFSSDLIL